MSSLSFLLVVSCVLAVASGHGRPHNKSHGQDDHHTLTHGRLHGKPHVKDDHHASTHGRLHDKSHVQDKQHLREHFQGIIDLDRASEDELRFHYFTSHDVEGNGKLDGCELVQALLHFHTEESATHGFESRPLTDGELSVMVDNVLFMDDKNLDGFIDYSEFVAGQISKGL